MTALLREMKKLGTWFVWPAFFVVLAVIGLIEPSARAIERNFVGSAQFDYHFVPTQQNAVPRSQVFDGFTTELALKLAVDVSDSFSANVKVCYGCHGFEVPLAHFDYRVADELNFRIGRFSPSLGAFNLRYDPANHRLSSKPLMYDMGRMLRLREWNMGVIPSPFPDNGVEVNGTHWFGSSVQLDYAAYAISGFKADADAADLDWVKSRSPSLYYVDNNSRPATGGRMSATTKLGAESDMTVGASAQYGSFDPENRHSYLFYGADVSLRVHRTNVRVEYLARRQEFDVSDPSRFKYVIPTHGGDFFVKHGAYAEIEQPLSPLVDLIGRYDLLYRVGNVLLTSALSRQSAVSRFTVGASFNIERSLKLKVSTEVWDFSDAGDGGRHGAVGFHLAAVATY